MADIFISHSSRDSKTAMKVVNHLEANGLTCWISSRDIAAGSDWAATISSAINSAKVFLLLYSKNSSESEQVSRELGIVETKPNITIIPYRMDDTPLKGSFEYFLTYAHWICVDESNKDYKLDELCADIKSIPGITVRSAEQAAAAVPTVIGPPKAPPSEKKPGSHKKVILISSISAAAVLIVAVTAILLFSGSSDPVPVKDPADGTTSQTTSSAPTTTATGDDPAATAANSSGLTEVTGEEVYITFSGHVCLGNYTGTINANGKPEGQGEFDGSYLNDDNTGGTVYYKGGFVNGECWDNEAYAEQIWSDGKKCVLRCSYEHGTENGFGECTWTFPDSNNIIEYRGYWKNSNYHGQGQLTTMFEDGTIYKYKGEFKSGDCDGYGTLNIVYPESNEISTYIYNGQWSTGERDGKCTETFTYTNGRTDVYEGECVGGKHGGHGKLTCNFEDGSVYECEGEYSDGNPVDGTEYTYHNAKGKLIESGTWQNGEKVKNS